MNCIINKKKLNIRFKSQGSQWDEVDIILNDNYSEALSLNEFYTAVSRAKKKVTIWTTKDYLSKQLMKERDCRNTFIPLLHDKFKDTDIRELAGQDYNL